jgi:hypothetical protein
LDGESILLSNLNANSVTLDLFASSSADLTKATTELKAQLQDPNSALMQVVDMK